MKEQVFNLFLIGDESFISEIAIAAHDFEGDDSSKVALLQSKVDEDYKASKHYPLQVPMSWGKNAAISRMGRQLEIFEGLLKDLDAPTRPLFVLTSIVDGAPRLEDLVEVTQSKNDLRSSDTAIVSIDWLTKYSQNASLDLPRLFDDDYFIAIRLLFNNGHFVSAAKLLMSFIDTVAFAEFGDIPGNFAKWLDQYADLSALEISSTELWEFRNGLLHMTNLRPRGVLKGKVAPLILFVGGPAGYRRESVNGEKYFNLKSLLEVIANAVGKWIQTYNDHREKFEDFVQRYDLTISDSRTLLVRL